MAFTLGFAALHGNATLLYGVTALPDLGGGTTVARSMNEQGQIVGFSTVAGGGQHAFLYSAGTMTDLNRSAGFSDAWGINAAGQIVGQSSFDGQSGLTAASFSGGTATNLGSFGQASAIAVGIADNGDIAVRATTPVANGGSAFRSFYLSGGTSTDIGTLGSQFAFAYAMSSNGTIVGASGVVPGGTVNDHYHPFMYTRSGGIVDLGILGGLNGVAFGVNALDQPVGVSDGPGSGQSAFEYVSGSLVALPQVPGLGSNGGYDINDLGAAVGSAGNASTSRAVLYLGTGAFDLNNLLDPADPYFHQIRLTDAVAIDNSGRILALGCDIGDDCRSSIFSNGCGTNVHCHSYLLTPGVSSEPVPEPVAISLVGFGLAVTMRLRWRRTDVGGRSKR